MNNQVGQGERCPVFTVSKLMQMQNYHVKPQVLITAITTVNILLCKTSKQRQGGIRLGRLKIPVF